MRHNRRGEPIGRESGVYLYGASRREVYRKVGPVGVTSAAVRNQASTPLDLWPEPRNAVPARLTSNSALVPKVCEVCGSQPAEVVVVESIFACDRCAERIRAATGDQGANTGNRVPRFETESKPSIP
jgi:hypothetical protein